ncbi:MAG: hemerythrin domain-containing protein [Paracoccaceae bacterium]
MKDDILALATRPGLPDALRVLLSDYPRIGWEAHPNFSGLVEFWLERHLMFRQLLEHLNADVKARLNRDIDPARYDARLARYGSLLVNHLHGHHQVEDNHYFPQLKQLDTRLERGFDILDRDHDAMDGLLHRFGTSANKVLRADDEAAGREYAAAFQTELASFGRMLDRHLSDEEEIIVPVILKNGGAGLS